jgi:hypothetical protein
LSGDRRVFASQADAGGGFWVRSDSNVNINVASELTLPEYSQQLSRKLRNVIGLNDLAIEERCD